MTASSGTAPLRFGQRGYSNLKNKYFSYLIPSIFTHIALSLNEFVDSLVVANLLDSRALSIISLAGPVTFLITALYGLIGDGASTLYSICRGNHDRDGADSLFSVCMLVSAFISILLTVFGLLFSPQLAYLLGGQLGLEAELSVYLRYLFLAAPPIILTSAFNYFLPAAGHPVLSSVVSIVANVVNVLFDFLYIGVFGMGVEGAALATLTGFSAGFLIVLVFFFIKGKDIGRLKFPDAVFRRLGSICATGAPAASGQFGYAVKYAFCNSIAAVYAGQTGVIAFSICMQIASIISVFVGSMNSTMNPFLGTLVGMNDRSGSKSILRFTWRLQLICGLFFFALFELKPEILTTMYAVEAGPAADAVIRAIRIFSILLLLRWIYLVFRYVATFLGFKLYAFLIIIADAFVFLIPLSLILCPLLGIDGLWWAFVLSSVIILVGMFFINQTIAARSNGKYKGFWLITDDRNIVADYTFPADPGNIGPITLKIEKTCREHGMSMSRAMLASVSIEEMVMITSGSTASSGAIPMDVLIHKNQEVITIDLLSIGTPFNPTNCPEIEEIDSFEMLRRLSRSVSYEYVLGMNATRIIIAV